MTIREAASDYREEVRDGIAHIAIWRRKWSSGHKTWCALAFWADELNDNCEPVFSKEDAEELKAIAQEDSEAVLLNGYYCGWWRDYTIADIANAFRAHYEANNFLLADALEVSGKGRSL